MTPRHSAILRYWRHLSVTCLIVIGCSDGTGPDGQLGTYTVTVGFDGNTSPVGYGSLTFEPNGDDLTVTGAFTQTPGGTFTQFSNGTLEGRDVRFRVANQSWQFEGTVSADRTIIAGRHTRTVGTVITSGIWQALKSIGSPPPPG